MRTTTQASPATAPRTPAGPLTATRPRVVAVAVVAALALNIVIWLIGLAAGGDFTMTNAGEQQTVAPGGVVTFTVVPLAVGLTVAALVGRVWFAGLRVAQVAGPFLALVTIGGTIAADFDRASTVALAAMHVALAFPLVWALTNLRRLQAWAAPRD